MPELLRDIISGGSLLLLAWTARQLFNSSLTLAIHTEKHRVTERRVAKLEQKTGL